ncbi:MAG TPA: glycosyltransferase family 2 protein [Actinomycetota bacterium]
MAQLDTRAPRDPAHAGKVKPPSVLVVLVVKDGEAWLPQCLMGLARQTHPRIGVLAVDNGSDDRSPDLLETALGPGRVIRLSANAGFGSAIAVALGSERAQQADYALFLHDDTFLEPEAVAALVEAAERIEGVGVVGPKVLDWEQPQVLREIGLATDRFAYSYSPLEDGEIDQGQYDRIREVMYVSSCAMLVSRKTWARVGLPDERLASGRQDLDFCWRARLAGFRILMTPRAVARHLSAGFKGERAAPPGASVRRYDQERGALASILKNYGLLTLIWVLPLYLTQGLVRLLVLALFRRFQDAYQLLAAWGWNIAHLPGTLRRRVRAQAVRSLPDRAVRRAMAPTTIRLRRWAQSAGQALLPKREGAGEAEALSAPTRGFRFARDHPAATAWALGAVAAAFAYRHLPGVSPVQGGGLGAFPSSPSAFFAELVSGIRHTGLGGTTAASPALGLLGAGSVLALGNPTLLEKILLVALPAVAAIGCYRSVRAATDDPIPSVMAGACYGLCSAVLWAISQGRIPVLVFLAGLPWTAGKLVLPFDHLGAIRVRRWIVGAALGLAILGSFYLGAILAAVVVVVAVLIVPPTGARRVRGLVLVGVALALAALLAFPLTLEIARGSLRGMQDLAGEASFAALARLSLGPGPGSWVTGFFLPGAAGVALLFVSEQHHITALRAGVASVLSVYLAWLAAAGYLPAALSNPVAYVGVAGFSYSVLVGLGLASLLHGVGRTQFGLRQLGTALMAALLAVGLFGQLVQAGSASWDIGGPERVPVAYPLAGEAGGPPYRVLWVGSPEGDAFPPPGGLPTGTVAAGAASVRFAVTDPAGASALDIGRPDVGPGYARLRQSLVEVLAGETRHGGALLAAFGIRFVLAEPGDLPNPALRRLTRQVDLDLVSARGLTIFLNAKAVALASDIGDPAWSRAARSSRLEAVEALLTPRERPLVEGPSGQRFLGPGRSRPALVLLLDQFDPRWRLEPVVAKGSVEATRALGWATGFRTGPLPAGYRVHFGGQRARTMEIVILVLLWGVALWVTRRPVRHG